MKRLILFLLLSCLAGCGATADPPPAVTPLGDSQVKAHQKAWADQLGVPVQTTNSIGMKLNLISPGEFMMGSPASEPGRYRDETQHLVKITKPFYLGVHEVTQAQYERVMGNNPSLHKGENQPVEQVSWNDAVEFCRRLSEQEGDQYRLPTEAEWEYACRARTTTAHNFGDDVSQLGKYAWYGGSKTRAVGEKLPNRWGLYDMHGNVGEWCQDCYGPYESLNVVNDPTGPAQGRHRVLRGAAFHTRPESVRSALRVFYRPDLSSFAHGFRLARTYNSSP
jgi:formylglycine-generating enzyme required for sulfatase activity